MESPCDGIGGTTKGLVARASLQATENYQILLSYHMSQWANQNIAEIIFFNVSDQVSNNAKNLSTRIKKLKLYNNSGTISHHCFIPLTKSRLVTKRLSLDDEEAQV